MHPKEGYMSRRLSIFVDESGDFGSYQPHSPYYLVTMLFHDQDDSIAHGISFLNRNVQNIGFEPHALHTGPLIRRERVSASSLIRKNAPT
jgi:hypothetical protein